MKGQPQLIIQKTAKNEVGAWLRHQSKTSRNLIPNTNNKDLTPETDLRFRGNGAPRSSQE
jgi:hypothetical protein